MKKLAIGVDIGGINTAFGLVDENGDLYAESVISTKKYPHVDDYPAYIEDLCQAMHALADSLSFEYELTGIGIGAPNANFHKGTVENPANLWKFREGDPNPDESRRLFPLADDIGRCFGGVKVLVTNDANAATIGEMIYGNAKGMRDFVMITLGTGLGSGFVSNGEMIYGHDGFAGEFGHIIVERNGRECGCGRRGCLETYVSATGIKRTAFELMATMTAPSKLRDIAFADFDASMISAAAEQGDPVALEAFRYFHDRGVDINDGYGLACIHEVPFMSVLAPGMHVARMPVGRIGRESVRMLLEDMRRRKSAGEVPPAETVELECELCFRN